MRLLIYGGDSYSERRKLGDWPDIPAGALGDIYGLGSDVPAYGLGLLDDSPFLVFRRLNDVPGQRLYAFTLLLDPGREVWSRFGWNAAALAAAIFEHDGSVGNALLRSPEDFDQATLLEELEKLPAPGPAQMNPRGLLHALWAGASAPGGLVAAACEEIGFESRPAPGALAARLAALPPCFRTAGGWLMGGSKGHAQGFGANLLLDARIEDAPRTVEECAADGRAVLEAWERVADSPEYGGHLRRLSETPVWDWEVVAGAGPERVMEGVRLLARIIQAGELSEEQFDAVAKYVESGGPFEEQIRAAARDRVLEGERERPRNETRFILHEHFKRKVELPAWLGRWLHPEVTAEVFVQRDLAPDDPRHKLALRPETRLRIWRRCALEAGSVQESVALLERAIDDLSRRSPEGRPEMAAPLVEEVFRARVRASGLGPWRPLIESVVRERMDELLREAARERFTLRLGCTLSDYELAADDDGSFIAGLAYHPTDLHNFVAEIIASIQRGGGRWLEWLSRAASSPLRGRLQLDTKLAIIEYTQARGWEDFKLLWELFQGLPDPPPLKQPNDPVRRAALIGELACMARERKPVKTPHLSKIVDALGHLSDEALTALKGLRPKLDFQVADRWIEGWAKLGEKEFAAAEGRRLITQSNNPLPEKFTLSAYALADEEQVAALFDALLFSGEQVRDVVYRGRITVLFERGQHLELLRSSLRRAVTAAVGGSRNTAVFARRFVGKRDALDLIFACLTREHALWLMEATALHEPGNFEHDGYGFCTILLSAADGPDRRSIQDEVSKLINYGTAFCSFILSPAGAPYRKRLYAESNLNRDGQLGRVMRDYLAEHDGELPPSSAAVARAEEAAPPPEPETARSEPISLEKAAVREEAAGQQPGPVPTGGGFLSKARAKASGWYTKFNSWIEGDDEQRRATESAAGVAPAADEVGGRAEAPPSDEASSNGPTADPQITS